MISWKHNGHGNLELWDDGEVLATLLYTRSTEQWWYKLGSREDFKNLKHPAVYIPASIRVESAARWVVLKDVYQRLREQSRLLAERTETMKQWMLEQIGQDA